MIDELISYYESTLRWSGVITKKIPLWQRMTGSAILGIATVFVMFAFAYRPILCIGVAFGIFMLAMIISGIFMGMVVKEKLPELYISWYKLPLNDFNRYAMQNLIVYIEGLGLDDSGIAQLQVVIQRRAEKQRLGSILFAGAFTGLSIALWSAYVQVLLEHFKDYAIGLHLALGALFLLGASISALLVQATQLRDEVFNGYVKLSKLSEMISEARIILGANRSNNQKKNDDNI